MSDEDDLLGQHKGRSTIRDRIAAFEMLDRMGEVTQAQKTVRLMLVGFDRQEIAAIQQISPQQVSQNIYAEKNKGKGKKKAATKAD